MSLLDDRNHALRLLGAGVEEPEVSRRTLRALVRDGLAVWVDRRDGIVELTESGQVRAERLLADARLFLRRFGLD